MFRRFLVFVVSLFFVLIFAVEPTLAANCSIIYGGGEVKCDKSVSPTPPISPISQILPTNPSQTKGGLPVSKPVSADKTPATGPEVIGLISLIPMAAAGFYLRKKNLNEAEI